MLCVELPKRTIDTIDSASEPVIVMLPPGAAQQDASCQCLIVITSVAAVVAVVDLVLAWVRNPFYYAIQLGTGVTFSSLRRLQKADLPNLALSIGSQHSANNMNKQHEFPQGYVGYYVPTVLALKVILGLIAGLPSALKRYFGEYICASLWLMSQGPQ